MKQFRKCVNKPLYPLNVGEKLFLDGFGIVTVEHINSSQLSFPINVSIGVGGVGRLDFDWEGKNHKAASDQTLFKLCDGCLS